MTINIKLKDGSDVQLNDVARIVEIVDGDIGRIFEIPSDFTFMKSNNYAYSFQGNEIFVIYGSDITSVHFL